MISLLAQWNLWEDSWIGLQHVFNEVFLITICMTLLVLSNAFDLPYSRMEQAGWFVIALVVIFIVFNFVILLYDVSMFMRIHLMRTQKLVERRRTRMTIQQVNRVTEEAQAYLIKLALQGGF